MVAGVSNITIVSIEYKTPVLDHNDPLTTTRSKFVQDYFLMIGRVELLLHAS